ncbi:MAG: LCP family protein [Candidatus Magasanikbacteria bacterium]
MDPTEIRHINFLHENPEPEPPKRRRSGRWIFVLMLIGLIIAGGIGYAANQKQPDLDPLDYDPVTLEPKQPEGFLKKLSYLVFKKEVKLEGAKNDRINILLLGMGGPGHDGPYLTDTMMIASIKPSTNEVALISIPRDLGVAIPGYGTRKINHANAFGEMEKENWGGAFATQVVADAFDMDIPYYIRMDFAAFEEIINEVGGIRVNVDKAFTDYMFPAPRDQYQTISFKQGPQTMDGKIALNFVRSRHGNNGEGSDFARARRQQKVILALKEKVLSFSTLTNPVRIKKIMDSLERHMTTNMNFDAIVGLVRMARSINTDNVKTLVLDNATNGFLISSNHPTAGFLLTPKTGNFNEIQQAISTIFENNELTKKDTTPEQEKPRYDTAVVEVQNGTWRAGTAARLKQQLTEANFYVDAVGNTDPAYKPITISGIYKISDNESLEVMQALQNSLHIPIKQTPPEGIIPTATSTDILVIVGDDFVE